MTTGGEADRRSHNRFEVVGQLWGYFTVSDSLSVRDVSDDGALVRSMVPLTVGSVHAIRLSTGAGSAALRFRVTHVRLDTDGGGADGGHLIGLECIDEEREVWRQAVAELRGERHDTA